MRLLYYKVKNNRKCLNFNIKYNKELSNKGKLSLKKHKKIFMISKVIYNNLLS